MPSRSRCNGRACPTGNRRSRAFWCCASKGPAAIEIQHLAPQILERVNRFFGFAAVGRLAIRQAPVVRRARRKAAAPDPEAVKRMAESLPGIEDESLKDALARLGASVKRETR